MINGSIRQSALSQQPEREKEKECGGAFSAKLCQVWLIAEG